MIRIGFEAVLKPFFRIISWAWHHYGRSMEQGRPLYFLSYGFFCLLSFHLFSSPILSCRRLDVYHTFTRGVALVRIQDAGLKCAARCSLKIQDAKFTQKFAMVRTTLSCYIFVTEACIDYRKKYLLNSNIPPTYPYHMVNFAHQRLRSVCQFVAPQLISMSFASWQRYCTAHQQWASAKLCGVEQRAPPIFGRLAITLGIGPHSSSPVIVLYVSFCGAARVTLTRTRCI